VDSDRRRHLARDLLAAVDAIPADIAGRAPLTVGELLAVMAIEAALWDDLLARAEFGTTVAAYLDQDLTEQGGWRYDTEAETAGDDAWTMLSLFRESRSWR
jgi:hypothetical protein